MSETITATFATNSSTGQTVTVTQAPDGTWTGGGLTCGPCAEASAAGYFAMHTLEGDTPPTPLVPTTAQMVAQVTSVPLWQIKIALNRTPNPANPSQTMLAAASAVIAAQSSDIELQIAWTGNPDVTRSSPTLAGIANALGLGAAEIDALYLAASTIEI